MTNCILIPSNGWTYNPITDRKAQDRVNSSRATKHVDYITSMLLTLDIQTHFQQCEIYVCVFQSSTLHLSSIVETLQRNIV